MSCNEAAIRGNGWRRQFSVKSCLMYGFALGLSSFCIYSLKPSKTTKMRRNLSSSAPTTTHITEDMSVAYKESMGFFDDIPNRSWALMKDNVKNFYNEHKFPHDSMRVSNQPHYWYQYNWEPNFSCSQERRVGGMGDGPKWVCNPHRIVPMAKEREDRGGGKCLIYSIGCGENYMFEDAMVEMLGLDNCEIHLFDPVNYSRKTPKHMHFHHWGLLNNNRKKKGDNFKSLQETVKELGHEGRVVDVFKIDCEGCEWETYKDWFQSGLDIRQILVETHYVALNSNDFFETMRDKGYVIFHKEPNTIAEGMCQEYAFLKLGQDFFV